LKELDTLPTSSLLTMSMRLQRSASPEATSAMRSCKASSGIKAFRNTVPVAIAMPNMATIARATNDRMTPRVRLLTSACRIATIESMSSM